MSEDGVLARIIKRRLVEIGGFNGMTYEEQREINAEIIRELDSIPPETIQREYLLLLDDFGGADACVRSSLLRHMRKYIEFSEPEGELRHALVSRMLALLFQPAVWECVLEELETWSLFAFSSSLECYEPSLNRCISLLRHPETQLRGLRILVMLCRKFSQRKHLMYTELFKVIQEEFRNCSGDDDVLANLFDLFCEFSEWIKDDPDNTLPLALTNYVLKNMPSREALEHALEFLSQMLHASAQSEISRELWEQEIKLTMEAVSRFLDDYSPALAYWISTLLAHVLELGLFSGFDNLCRVVDVTSHFSELTGGIDTENIVEFYLTNYRSNLYDKKSPRFAATIVMRRICKMGFAREVFAYLAGKDELREIDFYLLSVVVQFLGDIGEYEESIVRVVRSAEVGSLEFLSALALIHGVYETGRALPQIEPPLKNLYSRYTPEVLKNRKLGAYEQLLFAFSAHFMAIQAIRGIPTSLSYVCFCLEHQECLIYDDLIAIISSVWVVSHCKESYELYKYVVQQINDDIDDIEMTYFEEHKIHTKLLMDCLERLAAQSYHECFAEATARALSRILMSGTDAIYSLDLPLTPLLEQHPSYFIPVVMDYIRNLEQHLDLSDILVKPLIYLINDHPDTVVEEQCSGQIIESVLEILRGIEFPGIEQEAGDLFYNLSTLAVRMNAVGGDFEWGELFGELSVVVSRLPVDLSGNILGQIGLEIECYRFSQEDVMCITECLLMEPSLPLSFVDFAEHVFETNNVQNEIHWAVLKNQAVTFSDENSPFSTLSDVAYC